MKLITPFVALSIMVTFVLMTFFVNADVEPINHKSFSIYDFVGGLWQINQNFYYSAATTSSGDAAAAGDSIVSRVSDAVTPDFISSCTVEGRQGFPSPSAKIVGLPPDLDIGTGNSRVVVCSFTVNEKAWKDKPTFAAAGAGAGAGVGSGASSSSSTPLIPQKIGMKLNPSHPSINTPMATQLFIVPSSMNSAVLYQVTPFAAIADKKEKKFFADKYKIAATTDAASVFVVTHTGNLHVKHQFKVIGDASAAHNKELSSLLAALPQRAKHGFAHGSAVLVPLYKQPPQHDVQQKQKEQILEAVDDDDDQEQLPCQMQVTRVSALFTTKTDAIVNVAVQYTGDGELCFGEEEKLHSNDEPHEEDGDENHEQQVPEQLGKTVNRSKRTATSTTKNSSRRNPRAEAGELFLLNAKRFASIYDEEMTLDPDTPWYKKNKFAPSIGAFVLLFVIVGGRKAVAWYLRRRGIDVDQFLKSSKQKTKEEILRMRRERMAAKGGTDTPMTDEEVARLQVLEQQEDSKRATAAALAYQASVDKKE